MSAVPTPRSRFPGLPVRAWMLLAIAILVRGVAMWVQFDQLHQDPDAYRSIAECLARHGVLGSTSSTASGIALRPTAFRPPLYPIVLSLLAQRGDLPLPRVAILHVVLGVATVMLTYWLAEKWCGAGAGFWSGLWVTFDPLLLHQSSLVMTETCATLMTVAILAAATRWRESPNVARGVLLGMVLGLASLCRPTFLPFAAILTGTLGWYSLASPSPRRQILAQILAIILGIGVVLSPWAVRNYVVFGKPIVTTTHGGYTLLLGNNPHFYDYLRTDETGVAWEPGEFHADWNRRAFVADPTKLFDRAISDGKAIHRSEREEDRFAYDAAEASIHRDPGTFARACLVRLAWFWRPLPQATSRSESGKVRWSRYAVAAWYAVLYGFVIVGFVRSLARLRKSPWLWGVLLCVTFTAMHCIYWSNIRMRAPLIPVLALFATLGCTGKAVFPRSILVPAALSRP